MKMEVDGVMRKTVRLALESGMLREKIVSFMLSRAFRSFQTKSSHDKIMV